MFGFDPAHTPLLEQSLKGDYRKGIPAQRTIQVPNAFAWVDTDGDGLGDSWAISAGTPGIVTGNGFAGRAQRLLAGAAARILRTSSTLAVKGASYRLRFRWRSGSNLQVRLGSGTFLSLGSNTGNAVFYDGILKAGSTSSLQFQVSAGDYIEVSEIELWEATPARLQDEGRNRSIHGILYSGKAFTLDGVSSFIDCGNNTSLQVTSAFSICFWIKTATNGKVILSKDDTGSNRSFQLLKDSSGKLSFITVSGATVSTLTETTASIDDEIWHRVVCTYDGSTKAIYVDGTLSASGSVSGAANNAAVNLFIGKLGNNTAYLSAALSDIQLWNKALSGTDIVFDFQYPEKAAWQRNGSTLVAADLKGHWWLCENYGYYAFDYSGNSNHAALYGPTAYIQQKDIPQPALVPYSQKVFCTVDTILRAADATLLRSIWNNGGKLSLQVVPYSDGEADQGIILTKTQWILRGEAQSSGKIKLRFIVSFSTTNGEWVTTNPEVTLGQLSSISVEYNSASTANTPVIKVNGSSVALTAVFTPAGTYVADTGSLLYAGDNAGSTAAFEGIIDSIQVYNTNTLKGSWNNEGIYRWSDVSGNNNHLVSSSNNKEIFLLQDLTNPGKDILGLTLSNVVKRYGINLDAKSYSESGFGPAINFNAATEDFTVTLWVRFSRPLTGLIQLFLSMQNSISTGFSLYLDDSLRLVSTLNALTSVSTTTIQDSLWHFIVCTVDRDDKMKLYLDGTEVTYTTQDNLLSQAMVNTTNLRLGSHSYSANNFFKGQLAGFTLHRKLLSDEEQKHLYGFGKSHYS
jgi:hypothetical protein